jgi:hypothetical protein
MTQRIRRRFTRGWVLGPIAMVLLGFGLLTTAAAADRGGERLVGTWRLVRYIDTPEGGAPIQAFGDAPIGLFIFTADGHVSINIMRNPPAVDAATTDPDPDACIPGWYCAYFGTYVVDRDKGFWVTHVLGGNIPAYLGTDQQRSFTIRGDRLVISETYLQDGKPVQAERELVRDLPGRP